MIEFVPFPKIPRLNRDCVITEKIDGTNASVLVEEDGTVTAASRTRWITPADDNFGFARYVAENEDTFRELGPGLHRGEWWGQGIQRGYGLKVKRFSLLNTGKWNEDTVPKGLFVVPVLFEGLFSTPAVAAALGALRRWGSMAAPRFTRPEGVVIYHTAANSYFKVTLEHDQEGKGT
jgi:hypothetical protein